MAKHNVICLVIDGLRSSDLGAYGNTWYPTPWLDRLASESFTLDQASVDAVDLKRVYRSYWLGLHALRPDSAAAQGPSMIEALAKSGLQTTLLTDAPDVANHSLSGAFSETILVETAAAREPAADVAETQMARLLAVAMEWLDRAMTTGRPFLLWIHAQGLHGPWDAPMALRHQIVDDDEVQPYSGTTLPQRMLARDGAEDELLSFFYAYGAQVMVLDECLAPLREWLARCEPGKHTLFTLTASRGFSLGEHHRIGPVDQALYGEILRVPWLVRLPETEKALDRSQALVQPADLPATIADWLDVRWPDSPRDGRSVLPLIRGELPPWRDSVCATAEGGELALLTPSWYLRMHAAQGAELFAKPDDRWEANEVSSRCQDVVASLQTALASLTHSLASDDARENDSPR
jgi:hypothetical protein